LLLKPQHEDIKEGASSHLGKVLPLVFFGPTFTCHIDVVPLISLQTTTIGLPFGLLSADKNTSPSGPRSPTPATFFIANPASLSMLSGASVFRWFA
jgi:hypothetical protein